MSTFLHIDHLPSRNPATRRPGRSTIDEKRQAVSSSSSIPGVNLLNRNRTDFLAGINNPPSWSVDTPCAQADPDAWFPEKGGSPAEAKRICADCDVREQCLQWALDNKEHWGIWGGMSEHDRRRIRAERSKGDAA